MHYLLKSASPAQLTFLIVIVKSDAAAQLSGNKAAHAFLIF